MKFQSLDNKRKLDGELRINDVEFVDDVARSQFGMARTSLYNISFPEPNAIRLFGYGRVKLEFEKRIGRDGVLHLQSKLNDNIETNSDRRVGLRTLRGLVQDAEEAFIHWAADSLSNETADINPKIIEAMVNISNAIEILLGMDSKDREKLAFYLSTIAPDLIPPLGQRDRLDSLLLKASAPIIRRGRNRTGSKLDNSLIDFLLDDWRRRTHRPIDLATSPGSAHHYVVTMVEWFWTYPPPASESPINAEMARLLPDLRHNLEKPLWNAVRNETETD